MPACESCICGLLVWAGVAEGFGREQVQATVATEGLDVETCGHSLRYAHCQKETWSAPLAAASIWHQRLRLTCIDGVSGPGVARPTRLFDFGRSGGHPR